jgi:LmbE family N-acetylglucosaminyl deacetylase
VTKQELPAALPIDRLDARCRLLVFAPHPDDESLPAGIVLQRAVSSGARVRLVYATDGEKNPWPQRVWAKRWKLREVDEIRWRETRRKEALRALSVLGVEDAAADFLALPDQGLTPLLLERGEETAASLARRIEEWQPTHILGPSVNDTHPDHSALAILLNFAIYVLPRSEAGTALWTYLVHGDRKHFATTAVVVRASVGEKRRKRTAIGCHKTQLQLSRRRLLAYARRSELFRPQNLKPPQRGKVGPLRLGEQCGDAVRLRVVTPRGPLPTRRQTLQVVGRGALGGVIAFELQVVPKRGRKIECGADSLGFMQCQRDEGMEYEIVIAMDHFDLTKPIFAKLAGRSIGLFDAGWLEVSPAGLASPDGIKVPPFSEGLLMKIS